MAQWQRIRPPRQEMQVQSLGQEDPLEKQMASPVFLPRKFHGQRSLVSYSPRCRRRVRHIYMEFRKMLMITLYAEQKKKKKTQIYRTVFWTLWEKARVWCFKRTASKHVYYLGWNGSPAQVGCMRQALGPGAMGKPRGSGWRGRGERGSGWGTHVNPWLFLFNVWQNPPQIKKK